MRPEGSSLDLNNFPEEYGKQAMEESSTTTATSADNTSSNAGTKKKSAKEGKEDGGNIYECRFCSLKFCKSQALGGHMNRHRQERETETLNRARQLVFSNDGFAAVGSHMGLRDIKNFREGSGQSKTSGCFPRHRAAIGDPCLHFRPVYPMLQARPPSSSSSDLQPQPYMYGASSSRPPPYAAAPPHPPAPPTPANDYYVGRVLGGGSQAQPQNLVTSMDLNYARMGASLTQRTSSMEGVQQAVMSRDATAGSWSCIYGYGQHSSSEASATDPF